MSTNGPNALYGGDGQTIDLDAAQAAWKAEQAKRNKPTTTTSDTKVSVDPADIATIANEKPDAIAPPKKKTSGTLTYDKSYTAEVAKKWEAKGGTKEQAKANYIKAAKAWNEKKYGTTEPTAKAKKLGISKTELSEASKPVKMERKGVSPNVGSGGFQGASRTTSESKELYKNDRSHVSAMAGNQINETKSNERLQQAIASANAPESLMSGTKTRRETRRQRQDDRIANRRQRQDDRVENRQQRQENRKTKDFSDGVYSTGAKATKSTMPSDKVISAMGKALSTSGTPKTETKKKKTGGEFWGKSGPIK